MADYEINDRVDITDVVCPMTFVKAKVAMEELEIGQVLAVTMTASLYRMYQEASRRKDSRS
jgi:TusA-related sulfurtransferase